MIHLPSKSALLSLYMFISMPYTIARAICIHDYDMLPPSHGGTMTMTYEAPVVIGWCVPDTPSHGVDPSTHVIIRVFVITYIPEIGMPTYRTTAVDVVNNDEELRLNLDLLEERRELAAMNEARSKSKMTKYYNSRVRGVAFQPREFVYRSNDASHAVAGGKLGPKWEGPYEVTDALGNGAYKLRSTDGTVLPRTWNVTNLKRCYL
nr:reverse transcriptase domain-containing protein [Tanacetum cinerariifolium]